MRKLYRAIAIALILMLVTTSMVAAGGNSRRSAILLGADHVVDLQRTDTGWEGTWYWYVGSTSNATNLTGVTALGLLEAYHDTKDPAYLDAAVAAAGFIQAHLGAGATGTQYHARLTAPDVIFLHRLSEVTGDASYATRAAAEWSNITITYPTAGDLDTLFKAIPRRSAWDFAFFMEAAYLSGDTTWADDAAAIIADTTDTFYYGTDTWWYALNVSAAVRALVGCGYAGQYNDALIFMMGELVSFTSEDNGVDGYVQDTAYAIMAYNAVGGAARRYANDLGRWLATEQLDNGGWLEPDDTEYPEADGEAVRALASTIGTDVTIDGFEPGAGGSFTSSWVRTVDHRAVPFNGE